MAVKARFSLWTAFGRLMPIWLTVLLLLITRIPQLQIKGILQSYVPLALMPASLSCVMWPAASVNTRIGLHMSQLCCTTYQSMKNNNNKNDNNNT